MELCSFSVLAQLCSALSDFFFNQCHPNKKFVVVMWHHGDVWEYIPIYEKKQNNFLHSVSTVNMWNTFQMHNISVCNYVKLIADQDTHMSPRKRLGHTSSTWWHERGAECKISSSSWRVGVSPVLHMCSSFSSVSVHFESSVTHFSPITTPDISVF